MPRVSIVEAMRLGGGEGWTCCSGMKVAEDFSIRSLAD